MRSFSTYSSVINSKQFHPALCFTRITYITNCPIFPLQFMNRKIVQLISICCVRSTSNDEMKLVPPPRPV